MKLLLYFHTIRHLRFRQLWYQFWYRARDVVRKFYGYKYRLSIAAEGEQLKLSQYIPKPKTLFIPDRFIFLNKEATFTTWDDDRFGALWKYNLNYMDYINQEQSYYSQGREWINSFIACHDDNKCGKDPYPISLRTINWIKFIWNFKEQISAEELKIWDFSLFAQYRILLDKLEYNLYGNHLLENAYSLLWGALYFKDKKIYRKAEKLLFHQLEEQILPDGGHFELSPMYHCILLDKLLDCINVSQNNETYEGQSRLTTFMRTKATMMLGWLEAIKYNDGTIPLFNDSAYGIAPSIQQLFRYAERLSLTWEKVKLKESGYRKFIAAGAEMIIDVGEIGASYIPGHAHADTFTYELRIGGTPFLIDTGISTYEKNERRAYERSTSAHNTLTINGRNSSEVWGGFRVANRAHIINLEEETYKVTAAHDGFKKYGVVHERTWEIVGECYKITDRIHGIDTVPATGVLVFDPEVEILSVTKNMITTSTGIIILSGVEEIYRNKVEISRYYNRPEITESFRFEFAGEMEYSIIITNGL